MKKYNRALNWTVQALAELRAGKPVTASTFEKHILARKLLNFPDRPAFKVQRFKSKVTKTFRLKSGTFMDKGDENPIHQALKRFKFKIAQKTKTQTDDAKITHIRWERGPVTVQETVSVYEDETLVEFLLVTPASAVVSMKLEAATRLKATSILASGGPNFLKIVSILEKALGGEADTKSSDPSPWATLTLSKSITLTNLYKALVSAGFTKEGVGSGKGGYRAIFLAHGGKLPFTIGAYTSGSELTISGPLRHKFVKPLTDIPAKSMLADVAFFNKLCSCKFKAGVSKKTGYPLLQYIGKGDRASIETALDQELESLEPSKLFRNVQPTSSGRVWFSKDHGCVVHVERAGVDRVGISII